MPEQPLLTVIMPVYNVEKYLFKALESMLAQTFTDWELIALDDGSTDNSGKILDDYAARDVRIKAIYQVNGGATSARKTALKLSRGQYVTFFDSDDWIEPDMYERLLRYMQAEKLDIVVGGHVEEHHGEVRQLYQPMKTQVFSPVQAKVELLSHRHHAWGLWDKLYHRSLLDGYNLSQHIIYGEDLLTNWLVYQKAERIGYVPVYGYHYVKYDGSLTTADFSWKRYTIMKVLDKIARDCEKMQPEVRQAFYTAWRSRVLGVMTRMVISGDLEFYEEFQKQQRCIRADFCGCLKDECLSIPCKMLACYFALPALLCRAGKPILVLGEQLIKR